jgi:hypothetical protein|tara:strand:+ start:1391 stop:1669 length:279 start_codon:yes stop_codon:yes gene_type:complete
MSYHHDCDEEINKIIEKSNLDNDIINIIQKLENNSEYYLNLEKTKNEFNKMIRNILEKNYVDPKNNCQECGIDIGRDNPRQLCGKTRCHNEI